MKEIWKDIKGYEGYYQISNFGRVKSLDRYVATTGNPSGKRLIKGKLKKPTERIGKNGNGYYHINLDKNNNSKLFTIHKLVAETFIPNPDNLPCINHKDENKHNNHVDNLEWCTIAYNNIYGTARERAGSKMRIKVLKFDLQGNLLRQYDGLGMASKEENISKGNIENVCTHRNGKKTLNGFIFMYEDDYIKNGFIGYKSTKNRMINKYDLNGKFICSYESIKQAGESIPYLSNNGESNITAVCRGRQKTAYGYIWRYSDDVDDINKAS